MKTAVKSVSQFNFTTHRMSVHCMAKCMDFNTCSVPLDENRTQKIVQTKCLVIFICFLFRAFADWPRLHVNLAIYTVNMYT